jgi:guanine deaminase
MNKYMEKAKQNAENGILKKEGGPFGAIIVDKEGNIISNGNNQVLKNNDPTAHAEIVAIREACKKLNTYDLKNYTLYTSCEPCPMCLSAIIWANIKEVYYGCTKEDAGKIGFRDDIIYDYLKGKNKDLINLKQIDREECIKTFEEYKNNNGVIY